MMRPPNHVLGNGVIIDEVLMRDDEVTLAITSVTSYPQGFELTLHVRNRRKREMTDNPVRDLLHGPRSLALEITYGDGRPARADTVRVPGQKLPDDGPLFVALGGSGNSARMDLRYWVAPLPLPIEKVLVKASWLERSFEDASINLPADRIVAASRTALQLWDADEA